MSPRRTASLLLLLLGAGCRAEEPVGSTVPARPSAEATTGDATARPTTELGAVSLPDTKRCAEGCAAGDAGEACRKRCAEQCLAHCHTQRASSAERASACEQDCRSQLEAANTSD